MKNKGSFKPNFLYEKKIGGVILGIDEVGRGCVAGPVVVAGVILNDNIDTSEIMDSKKLTPNKREKIVNYLKDHCYYLIESSSVEEIEEMNILQASLLAMRRVINNIEHKFDHVFVDGNVSPDKSMNNISAIIGGDSKSLSIAAASIFAKVARDKLMDKLDQDYPHYLWKQNKGYGTKQHIDAIKKFGITPHHRKSFLKKIIG
jgi:ribonuclease HII